MNPYLTHYVETLTSRRQERVSTLLEEARVGKEQLEIVSKRLQETIAGFTPIILKEASHLGIVQSSSTLLNLRDIALKMQELFDVSNLISLLLESHTSVLSSDIVAIEKELIAMEKFITNYDFLLSDNKAYNYTYLEPFNDLNGWQAYEGVSDRSGIVFQSHDTAVVRPDEGVLTLASDTLLLASNITVEAVKGNCSAFVIEETDIQEVVRPNEKGWRAVYATANPVTAPLPGTTEKGAQVLIEFTLSGSAIASELKMIPFADLPIEIAQVWLYPTDSDSEPIELLETTQILDKPFTINFPVQVVERFQILVNQPAYKRGFANYNTTEDKYRRMISRINKYNRDNRLANLSREKFKVERHLKINNASMSRPITKLRPDRGAMGEDNIVDAIRHNKWRIKGNTSLAASGYAIGPNRNRFAVDSTNLDSAQMQSLRMIRNDHSPASSTFAKSFTDIPYKTQFSYNYTLGLKRVSIGISNPMFKGVFVSKPLPASGDIGEVQLKASSVNIEEHRSARDFPGLTSVEYSVTTKSENLTESDWIPILPIPDTDVRGERLFLDANGKGFLRFRADRSGEVSIYKNGFRVPSEDYDLITETNYILGVQFLKKPAVQDIFVCSYIPISGSNVVNFIGRGFDQTPVLVSASDSNGAGEFFSGTGSRNSVQLSHEPYVDLSINSNPIIVKFDNGMTAINSTDYLNGEDTRFPSSGYYYRHSGSLLIFNQPVTVPFKVFYQYVQNNVSFRVVLRCNDTKFSSPKVDFVHIKAKTRRSIVRADPTLYGDYSVQS